MKRIFVIEKKKIILLAVILIGLLLIGIKSAYDQRTWKASLFIPGFNNRVVIIDPGHGGADPGAVTNDVLEKDINLSISKKIATILAENGIQNYLTREESGGLNPHKPMNRMERRENLTKRKQYGIDHQGNVFISIHANSLNDSSVSGIMVFYGQSSQYNKLLAESVANEISKATGRRVPVKTARYLVIHDNPIPSILVEVGFLSNKNDLTNLTDNNYRGKLAGAIVHGIQDYSVQMEGLNVNGTN